MPGSGKRRALQSRLAEIAARRGLPFQITMKPILTATATQGEEEGGGSEDADTGQIMAESSLVHMGFDIARMSMKDKQVLIPILSSLGSGSHVLAGHHGRSSRILVFYHAHLLSSESVLLLQSCLEMNEGDVSVWFTSELPVPQRIRDWFVEIPVAATTDYSLAPYQRSSQVALKSWSDIFQALLNRWRVASPPTIETVKEVKAFVYELLMRNLRWPEAVHHLLDVLLTNTAITEEQRRACVAALANCEATAGGYTIPSYRIPILWESLFLQFRNIVHRGESPKPTDATARTKRIGRGSKRGVAPAGAALERGEANARGDASL
jgi:hypothetical protein